MHYPVMNMVDFIRAIDAVSNEFGNHIAHCSLLLMG